MSKISGLFSTERERQSTFTRKSAIEEYLSDKSRIVYSASFRRLQKKAQVFSLESNASVRTRMTHSIEVSDVGKHLAFRIGKELAGGEVDLPINLMNIIECACLLHDIGNPPFGHFGEFAIQSWFKNNWEGAYMKATNLSQVLPQHEINKSIADFIKFDGNPQGLRIILKLQSLGDNFGMNLTHTTIGTCIKYPAIDPFPPSKVKLGVFYTEKEQIKKIWEKLGTKKNLRFPLSYIMEAADDIAYCMSDIQDGLEKRMITWDECVKGISTEWKKESNEEFPFGFDKLDASTFATKWARTLIDYAAKEYIENIDLFLNGSRDSVIPPDSIYYKGLESIKRFCRKYLYRDSQTENIEIAGFKIITGILDAYRPILELGKDDFDLLSKAKEDPKVIKGKGLDYCFRLFNKLPIKHLFTYNSDLKANVAEEWILRSHLITDYISGMTDDFALDTYQLLTGIKL